MIIDKLRAGTRHTHEELEREMLPLIKSATDAGSYAKLLRLFYGYFKPLEDAIGQYLDASIIPDFAERRKTDLLISDLAALGDVSPIKTDPNAPSISNAAEALGAMYVMEGSTLGGKVISKMIAENLGIADESGLSFFYGYGGRTGSKWKAFLAVLDAYSDGPQEAEIVRKADEVFRNFRTWLQSVAPGS